jgi:NADPH-dependent 2,4-dienoyl-CoA reductase/sulfur reductase-like enzyme
VCSVNPKMGIDAAVRVIENPSKSKKVAVIGGGPAGMKAALIAAERGHKVTLYEKNDFLGGQARHADFSPFKWPLKDFKDYLVRMLGKQGVEVLLKTEATPEMIKAKRYETVIVALGSEPIIPKISGADAKNVWTVLNVYGREKELGKNVAFIGGGQYGVETAMYLAKCGHDVTVLSSERQLVRPTGPHQLSGMIEAYQQMKNLTPITGVRATGISGGKVTYVDANGSEKSIQADSVVIYAGLKPRQDEAMKFSGTASQLLLIGECNGDGDGIQKSQRSAFFAGSQV